ncbi:quinoprotein dehydrogenase-associated SoxYZ-like carrier [Noviherbaspirillum sp. L7-7A]|uniref:quinoprotein dehydrogenase-associated SoxYZ-like carrier n=1 Tax=Noviherbaspirillum sp. L7-7A TaxID=2850560 RepID=UPI001C2B7F6A|nr:quinoprotein dehydrogenase-associated SoxYZ-like carrier [Noviherbaspirillum sp. L7-7A]MBV0881663.1 quinoprotein dehydrogenase-associated SoxYZ-like carrier [Noviherbaspirillum sp. L7-7A]
MRNLHATPARPTHRLRQACTAALIALAAAAMLQPAVAADNWSRIRPGLFQNRAIATDAALMVELVTPARAQDAAVVPITIKTRVPQSPERYISKLYLVIDKNPAPVAAVFSMTPDLGRADIETRVRIEEYTDVRVIVEMNDGSLHMSSNYVKASGGCSAPAGKDPAEAAAGIGKMKLALEQSGTLDQPQQVQLMIRHPNFSGLAMDQVTRLYTPPHFVRHLDVAYNGKRILSAETDISISENPNFRFYFVPHTEGTLTVEAVDSQDLSYRTSLVVKAN